MAQIDAVLCRNVEPWLAFIAMERGLRNLEKVRSLYKRCYARQFSDGSQVAFCQAWLRFEREEGRCAFAKYKLQDVTPVTLCSASTCMTGTAPG